MTRSAAAPAAAAAAPVLEAAAPKGHKGSTANVSKSSGNKENDPAATGVGSASSSKAAVAGAGKGSSTKTAAAGSAPSPDTVDSSALVALLVAAVKKCPDLALQVQAAMDDL